MQNTLMQVRTLVESEPGLSSSEIARRLNVTPGRISQVVKSLRDADVIQVRPKGRSHELHPSDSALRRKLLNQRWR